MTLAADDPDAVDPGALLAPYATRLWLPRYRAGRHRQWSLRVAFAAAARGYWGEAIVTNGAAVLTGPAADGPTTWMSIVPLEIESQEIGIAAAHGHTVVLGLGMGWAAANCALNPAVSRITVVERDPSVIALIADLGVFAQLPEEAREKIEMVEADAFEWRPDAPVDSLQADIWVKVCEPQKWDDFHRLYASIRPASAYFWGQEMELWRLVCRKAGGVPERLSRAELDALVAETGLPLVMSDAPDLGDRIATGRNGGPRGTRVGGRPDSMPCSCENRSPWLQTTPPVALGSCFRRSTIGLVMLDFLCQPLIWSLTLLVRPLRNRPESQPRDIVKLRQLPPRDRTARPREVCQLCPTTGLRKTSSIV